MKIKENAMVTLQYELLSGNNGDLIEKTSEENPLVFLYGLGMMLPAFEANLSEKEAGDSFEFTLLPNEAYGERKEEAIQDLDLNIFRMPDGNIDENMLKVGNVVPLMTQDGQRLQAVVKELKKEAVTMDFNHPMAGQSLHFKGTISEVREPSEEEISAMLGGGCCGGEQGSCGCETGEGHHGNCDDDHSCGCSH